MTDSAADLNDFAQRTRDVFFALRALSEGMLHDLDCTEPERGVLQDLELRGPQTVPALAQARAVSRQAMQKTIDRMAERKWIATEPNPRHQRSPLVAATAAGRKLFAHFRSREQRAFGKLKLPLSGKELDRTTRALEEMATFLGSLEPRPPSR